MAKEVKENKKSKKVVKSVDKVKKEKYDLKVDYVLDKKTYERMLRKVNSSYDMAYVIASSVLFLILFRNYILNNITFVLVSYLIAVLLFYGFLRLVNFGISKIFSRVAVNKGEIEFGDSSFIIDSEKITEINGSIKIEVRFDEIQNTNRKGNFYTISTKKMVMLVDGSCFEKDEDFEDVVNMIEDRFNKIKENKKKNK